MATSSKPKTFKDLVADSSKAAGPSNSNDDLEDEQFDDEETDEEGSDWDDAYDEMDGTTNRLRPCKIPFHCVYDKEEDVKERGYFLDGVACNVTINSAERDTSGGALNLFNPYIYTMTLEHGPYTWTIQRRYNEFSHLHNRLIGFRVAEQMKAPVRRLEYVLTHDSEEVPPPSSSRPAESGDHTCLKPAEPPLSLTFLSRSQEADDLAASSRTGDFDTVDKATTDASSAAIGKNGVKNADNAKCEHDHQHGDTTDGSAPPPDGAADVGSGDGSTRKRRRRNPNRLPHFPLWPDSIISEEHIQERKEILQTYLQRVLRNPKFLNHHETAEFLQVSRLSFVHNLGGKYKEGLLKKRPGGRRVFTGWKRFCIANCARWGKRWLMVKDTFVAYMDKHMEDVRAVMLFDSDFHVKAGEEETQGIKDGLLICNLQRQLLLCCPSRAEAEDWRRQICEVTQSGPGKLWLQEHRFGSSYPERPNTYAQWFVDADAFMTHAASVIELAREEIFITDWWLSPEIYMKRPMLEGDRWRLDVLLNRKAEQGVRIFVLLYKEVEMALGINSNYTKRLLQRMSPRIKVIRHPDHSPVPGTITLLWAHHEKVLCIDQNFAFVGGIDLCYGRWDDYKHRLTDLGSVQFQPQHGLHEGQHSHTILGGIRAMASALPDIALQSEILETQTNVKHPPPQPEATVSTTKDDDTPRTVDASDDDSLERMTAGEDAKAMEEMPLHKPEKTEDGITEEKVAHSNVSSQPKSEASRLLRDEGNTTDSGYGTVEPKSTKRATSEKKPSRWLTKAKMALDRSKSERLPTPDEPRLASTLNATSRTTDGGEMDMKKIVDAYKAYVSSGIAEKEKRLTGTPPNERAGKSKLTQALNKWRTARALKRLEKIKDDENIFGKEYEQAWEAIQKNEVPEDFTDDLGQGGKLWIGKDYVNFIFRDFVDLDMPFHDFIDRGVTPRMPWHDIHSVVYGSPARDVARHFIQRWNSAKVEKMKDYDDIPYLLPKSYENVRVPKVFRNMSHKCNVQILRSCGTWSVGMNATEDSIQQAYLHMIANAEHFIYIENQFFVSMISHPDVRNEICKTLIDRIERAYKNQETFRVYVMLPLMPAFEGELGATGAGALQAVLYWTYMSISRGPHSLFQNLSTRVDDPTKYIVFCGLRTHDELVGKLVTELLYIHSKMMVVDDRMAIIGSANINDRSMRGNRDSEVCIFVKDCEFDDSVMNGQPFKSGKFSGTLRRRCMMEHLGLLGEDEFTPKENCEIDVRDCTSDEFYLKTWLRIVSKNTDIYEKVFHPIPTNLVRRFEDLDPYQAQIPMAEFNKTAAREHLLKLQGTAVLFPTQFLVDANLQPSIMTKEGMAPNSLFT